MNPETNPIGVAGTISAALITLSTAIVAVLTAMGIVDWDSAQQAAINGAVVAVVDVAALVVPLVWASKQTTPLAKPEAKDGEPLVRSSDANRSRSAAVDLRKVR